VLVYARFAFVFESLHVIAQSIDEIVGELPVALPDVTQQVQVCLFGLKAA